MSTSRSLSNFDSAPIVVDLLRQVAELFHKFTLDNQVGQRGGDDAGQEVLFGNFAFLAPVHCAFFVGRLTVENVIVLGHAALKDDDLFWGELAFLHLPDQVGRVCRCDARRTEAGHTWNWPIAAAKRSWPSVPQSD